MSLLRRDPRSLFYRIRVGQIQLHSDVEIVGLSIATVLWNCVLAVLVFSTKQPPLYFLELSESLRPIFFYH